MSVVKDTIVEMLQEVGKELNMRVLGMNKIPAGDAKKAVTPILSQYKPGMKVKITFRLRNGRLIETTGVPGSTVHTCKLYMKEARAAGKYKDVAEGAIHSDVITEVAKLYIEKDATNTKNLDAVVKTMYSTLKSSHVATAGGK